MDWSGFDRIYYNLIDTENGKSLNLNITTKKVFTQNIGFKANTTDAAAILVNTTQKNYKNIFGLLSASAELSVNPGLSMVAETNKTNLPTLGINIKENIRITIFLMMAIRFSKPMYFILQDRFIL